MGVPTVKIAGYITTFDKQKKENGWLHLLVNEHDENELPIEQVYLTSCAPGDIKGPHMHGGTKCDRFYCVQGSAVLVCQDNDTKQIYEFYMDAFDMKVIHVPAYTSHGIVSKNGAILLSVTTEGYRSDKEHNQTETVYENYDWQQWLK